MRKGFILCCCIILFQSSSYATERIAIVGSTTVLPIISQAAKLYQQQHPDLVITVSGGGSGVGIAAVIQGTAQIGMASRHSTREEQTKLHQRQTNNISIATDAVAIVVSQAVFKSGITQLSLPQIAAIYRGQIRNWKELGGADARIVVIDKEASRGTRHVFAQAVLGNPYARAAGASLIAGSNNEEQAIMMRSDYAIGMLSKAWLNAQVRAIGIVMEKHIAHATPQDIQQGLYPIARQLQLIIPHNASPASHDFVAFILSPQGQAIVQQVGYLPI